MAASPVAIASCCLMFFTKVADSTFGLFTILLRHFLRTLYGTTIAVRRGKTLWNH